MTTKTICIVLLLLSLGSSGIHTLASGQANGRAKPIADRSKSVTSGPLKLNDADFWSDPRRTRAEIETPLLDADREALLFDAPQVVPIDVHETAPTQALRVARLSSMKQWPFRESAVVVGVDLDNNVVQAALAVRPSGRSVAPPSRSATPAQEGMGSETFTIDLRERLNLPWEAGQFMARLLIADQVTEARNLKLTVSASHVDPAVERFKAEERDKTRVPALLPAPSPGAVSYGRDNDSPQLPEGLGIQLSLPRVCALDANTPCLLRGSFRLPVLKRHIVAPDSAPGSEALREQWTKDVAQGRSMPVAVVPVTLVGLGSVATGPAVWRLMLPVLEPLTEQAGRQIGAGHFALDMRRLEGFGSQDQSWFVYGFSDASMAGPLTVGLARRPRTP